MRADDGGVVLPAEPGPVYLTVLQYSQVLNVGRKTIYDAVKAGKLKARKANARDLRIHRQWLLDWAEGRSQKK